MQGLNSLNVLVIFTQGLGSIENDNMAKQYDLFMFIGGGGEGRSHQHLILILRSHLCLPILKKNNYLKFLYFVIATNTAHRYCY